MEINIKNFTLLHNHLISILSTNNFGSQNLPQKIMQYIGIIVQSEKNPKQAEDFFDYFCEHNGNKIIKLTLQADPFLAVKVLSMLFINLKSKHWISFLLCQPFVTQAIQCQDIPDDEQWAQYFISLLKSLSIRLTQDDLSLFFNKKFCKFPLLYESLKYYNHPDCMVRTNVMNIILGIMKIKNPRLSKYFGSFPFTSYILTLCCEIKERIDKFELHLLEWDYCKQHQQSPQSICAKHKSIVKMYFVDMSDYICYLNDLIQLGPAQLGFFIRNTIYSYILLPTLRKMSPQTPKIQKKSAIYLIFILLKSINDDKFAETLCLLLFSQQLPKYYLDRIQQIEKQLYVPKVYSSEFCLSSYYWNKFDYQIQEYCLKIFQDINNFQTDHQFKKQDQDHKKSFMDQINSISGFLGYDILTYGQLPGKLPVSELRKYLNFTKQTKFNTISQKDKVLEKNYIRQAIFNQYNRSCAELDDDFCLSLSILFIFCIKSDCISNPALKKCGLLMPKFDMLNYQDQFNLDSILNLKNCILSSLIYLNKQQSSMQQIDCSLGSLRNMLFILDHVQYKRFRKDEENILLEFYTKCLKQIKSLLNLQNMKYIVENFQYDHSRWSKQALLADHSLPYTIFHKNTVNMLGEIDLLYLKHIQKPQAKVQYYIRLFTIFQAFYFRYLELFYVKQGLSSPVMIQRYQLRYQEKFGKIEQKWQIGKNYLIEYRNMIECRRMDKNNKPKKLIIVEDHHNLIIVQPSNDQNTAKIIINHPWKYAHLQIDRTNGIKMNIKVSKCIRSESNLNLIFADQIRSASTLQWMNSLKNERYQAQQALIFSYIKDCLHNYST